MVNWLMENKKEEINKINDQHSLLIAWIDYYGYVDRTEFEEVLEALGLKYDPILF